ncbi:MAG: tetratricopeptide repeat protein [Bacteroidales bacterium]
MKILFTILCWLLATASFSQFDFNENCREAYGAVIRLELDRGRDILETERVENPSNRIPLLIDNYIDFLRVFISGDEELFHRLEPRRAGRISRIRKSREDSPYYLCSLAMINLQWAFTRVKFGEYLRAAVEINRAYKYLEENKQRYPDFIPNDLGLGVLHVMIGSIPKQYKWVARLFSMEGSVKKGMHEIGGFVKKAENSAWAFQQAEGMFFLAFIQMNFSSFPEQPLPLAAKYDSLSRHNPLLAYAYGRYLMNRGENDKALRVFRGRPQDDGHYPLFYVDYLTGICLLNKLDPDCRPCIYRFVANFPGRNYIRSAWQKLAWSYLLEGDTLSYHHTMEKVRHYGDDWMESDQIALQEAVEGKPPNVELLKARLLFDGGYYDDALDVLERKDIRLCGKADTVAFYYRLGRIYHRQGKKPESIRYYQRTIDSGQGLDAYFAGNAALNLARIYETSGDTARALYYYDACLSMDFRDYEAAVKQKAMAGKSRIKP